MELGGYHTRYGYPRRWAILAELAWQLEHSWLSELLPAHKWRKTAEHHGYKNRKR